MVALSSIQTGSFTIASSATTGTATITAVDLGDTILWVSWNGGSNGPRDNLVRVNLTDTTTVSAFRKFGGSSTITLKFIVMEFSSGVSVQGLTDTQITDGDTITVSTVVTANSFISGNGISDDTSAFAWRDLHFVRSVLTNTTTITQNHRGGSDTDEWQAQLIESSDFDVEQVSDLAYTESGVTHSKSFTAIADVDAAFVCFSMEIVSALAVVDHDSWRGSISSNTNFLLTRGNADVDSENDLTFFVVEPSDATDIQQSTATISGSNLTATDTIASVDTDNTGLLGAGMMGMPHGDGNRTDDSFSATNMNVTQTSSTVLTYARAGSGGISATFGFWVVEWEAAAAVVVTVPYFEEPFAAAGGGHYEMMPYK